MYYLLLLHTNSIIIWHLTIKTSAIKIVTHINQVISASVMITLFTCTGQSFYSIVQISQRSVLALIAPFLQQLHSRKSKENGNHDQTVSGQLTQQRASNFTTRQCYHDWSSTCLNYRPFTHHLRHEFTLENGSTFLSVKRNGP